jgi:beta-mannosidase
LVYDNGLKEILGNNKPEETYLYAELIEGNKVISGDALYFLNPKNLNLQKADIKKEVSIKDGKASIKLSSSTLVKNVFLSLTNTDGFFSDNYFDLFPGKQVTISVEGVRDGVDLGKELQIISLVDTY